MAALPRPCGWLSRVVTQRRMGIEDREYDRQERKSGVFSQITPVVKWLLILNAGIYLLDLLLEPSWQYKPLREFGAFTIQSGIWQMRIWQLVTFQFLHGNLLHVIFNCIAIYFFGPWMERWWGARKFLYYYLLSGVGGALFFTLLVYLRVLPDGLTEQLVGASAGIYAIFVGVAFVAPDLRARLLFPPIELTMKQLAIGMLAIAAGSVIFRIGGNEGGEAGHLGGAIVGFILMRYPWLLGNDEAVEMTRPRLAPRRSLPKLRPRSAVEVEQDSAVDVILDKISREGFQSLTPAEKEVLQQAANAHQTPKK